jgi:hypothetical protein
VVAVRRDGKPRPNPQLTPTRRARDSVHRRRGPEAPVAADVWRAGPAGQRGRGRGGEQAEAGEEHSVWSARHPFAMAAAYPARGLRLLDPCGAAGEREPHPAVSDGLLAVE